MNGCPGNYCHDNYIIVKAIIVKTKFLCGSVSADEHLSVCLPKRAQMAAPRAVGRRRTNACDNIPRAVALPDTGKTAGPSFLLSPAIIALSIYTNFFTHHFIGDYRWYIAACALGLYARTTVIFRPLDRERSMGLEAVRRLGELARKAH